VEYIIKLTKRQTVWVHISEGRQFELSKTSFYCVHNNFSQLAIFPLILAHPNEMNNILRYWNKVKYKINNYSAMYDNISMIIATQI